MKVLITGLLVGLVFGVATLLYFSLAAFFGVQDQRRKVAVERTRNKLAAAATKIIAAKKKKAQAGK